jgi:acid stress chaperone HdeB
LTAAGRTGKRSALDHHQGTPTVKTFSAILVAMSLLAAAPASAQKLDLSAVTCKEFLDSGDHTISMVLMWLAGFYTDEDDPPIVDFDKMKSDTAKLTEYCRKNPTSGLIAAVEEALQ